MRAAADNFRVNDRGKQIVGDYAMFRISILLLFRQRIQSGLI